MSPNVIDLLWEPYLEAAREAWWKADYDRAAKILVAALKESEDRGKLDSCLVRSVENLARVLVVNRRYPDAERLLLRVFEGQEKLLGSDHPETVRCFDRLAAVREEWLTSAPEAYTCCDEEDGDDWVILELTEEEKFVCA